jgi:protein TonB
VRVRPPPRSWTALAVSTSVHALVLGLVASAVPASRVPTPLAVRLVSLPHPSVEGPFLATVEVEPVAALEGPRASATLPSASRPRRLAHAAAEAPPEATLPLPNSASESEAASAEGPRESPEAAAAGAAKAAEASAGGLGRSPPGGGVGDARLGELHRRLAEAAARCYPEAARRFRLTGEVPLRFCLDGRGTARAVSLEGSTGSPLLDRSALECVVPGAEPLPGFEGCFLVPVRFGG